MFLLRCLIIKSPTINKITVKISSQSYVVCNFIMVINTWTSYYTFITVLSPHGLKNEIYICIAHLLYCACFLFELDRTRHYYTYCIYLIKRQGIYQIFSISYAVFIQGWSLFEGGIFQNHLFLNHWNSYCKSFINIM